MHRALLSFVLACALLASLALAAASSHAAPAVPPTPTSVADPFVLAAAQPLDVQPMDGIVRLTPPAGCSLFEGASPSSAEDANGAIYWSAFSNCGGVWGLRVFRYAGGASSVVALPGGALPRARGILDMEPGGLYLTGWDSKIAYRIVVPGAEPWPPVMVRDQIGLPLIR